MAYYMQEDEVLEDYIMMKLQQDDDQATMQDLLKSVSIQDEYINERKQDET